VEEGGVKKLACFDQYFDSFRKKSGYELGNTSIDVGLIWRHRLHYCIQRDTAEGWIKDAKYGHSYNGRRIGTRMRSMDGAIFNDLE